jgi:hypothetical protein
MVKPTWWSGLRKKGEGEGHGFIADNEYARGAPERPYTCDACQRQMPQSRRCDAVASPSSHLGGKLGEVAAPGSHNQVPADISDGSNDQMYEQKQTASTDRLA